MSVVAIVTGATTSTTLHRLQSPTGVVTTEIAGDLELIVIFFICYANYRHEFLFRFFSAYV